MLACLVYLFRLVFCSSTFLYTTFSTSVGESDQPGRVGAVTAESLACAGLGGSAPCAAAGHRRAFGNAPHCRRALSGAAAASWRLGNTCGGARSMARGSDGQQGAASACMSTSRKRDPAPKRGVRQGRRSRTVALWDSAGCHRGAFGRLLWDAAAVRVVWASICAGPIRSSACCSSAGLLPATKGRAHDALGLRAFDFCARGHPSGRRGANMASRWAHQR